MSLTDRAILEEGHGGYSVYVRFDERWIRTEKPADQVEPPLELVARFHPYLYRVAAGGTKLEAWWAVPKRPGEVSSEAAVRLAYVFHDRRREQMEGVVIKDPAQLALWLEAMKRVGRRHR